MFVVYVYMFNNMKNQFFRSVLFCKFCEVKMAAEKKFTVTQHMSIEKYLREL